VPGGMWARSGMALRFRAPRPILDRPAPPTAPRGGSRRHPAASWASPRRSSTELAPPRRRSEPQERGDHRCGTHLPAQIWLQNRRPAAQPSWRTRPNHVRGTAADTSAVLRAANVAISGHAGRQAGRSVRVHWMQRPEPYGQPRPAGLPRGQGGASACWRELLPRQLRPRRRRRPRCDRQGCGTSPSHP
jgi:hypothetical protein